MNSSLDTESQKSYTQIQGGNFESILIKELCQILGTTKTRTTPYQPQSDGMIERYNRTLLNMLSIATEENPHDWDMIVPLLMMAYRSSTQETTKFTPIHLMSKQLTH